MPLAQEPRATLSIPEWRVLVFFQLFGFFAYIHKCNTYVGMCASCRTRTINSWKNQPKRASRRRPTKITNSPDTNTFEYIYIYVCMYSVHMCTLCLSLKFMWNFRFYDDDQHNEPDNDGDSHDVLVLMTTHISAFQALPIKPSRWLWVLVFLHEWKDQFDLQLSSGQVTSTSINILDGRKFFCSKEWNSPSVTKSSFFDLRALHHTDTC